MNKLSDIDPLVDGHSAEDVVNNRKAGEWLARRQAKAGDWICQDSLALSDMARSRGTYDPIYDDEMNDEDY